MAKDLMFQDEIKDAVREAYGSIPQAQVTSSPSGSTARRSLAELPAGARDWALGVGNLVRHSFLQPGEVVLDIGSGGGIDTILAARRVGPDGKAIGLDIVDAIYRPRSSERGGGRGRPMDGVPGWGDGADPAAGRVRRRRDLERRPEPVRARAGRWRISTRS